jgi:hypothetical protein
MRRREVQELKRFPAEASENVAEGLQHRPMQN